jgi:plastocyanin
MARPPLVPAAWTAAGALLVGAAVGCFSERQATAPADLPCTLPAGPGVAGSAVVLIRQFAFEPAEVRVRPGGRVTWVNCETAGPSHTSTADGGLWASPLLAPGDAFTRTFDAAGEFSYHCQPHPFMTGRVIAE